MNLADLIRQGRAAGAIPAAAADEHDIYLEYVYCIELNFRPEPQTILSDKAQMFRLFQTWKSKFPNDHVRVMMKRAHETEWKIAHEFRDY